MGLTLYCNILKGFSSTLEVKYRARDDLECRPKLSGDCHKTAFKYIFGSYKFPTDIRSGVMNVKFIWPKESFTKIKYLYGIYLVLM